MSYKNSDFKNSYQYLNFRDREIWIRDKKRIDTEMNNRLVAMKKRATTSGRLYHHIQVHFIIVKQN